MPRPHLCAASLGLLLVLESAGCQPGCGSATTFEAEGFTASRFGGSGDPSQVRIEKWPSASGGAAVHVGPDTGVVTEGIGDALTFKIALPRVSNGPERAAAIRYSDDVAGSAVSLYLDDVRRGSITTSDTGTWGDFAEACQQIDLGEIAEGDHTLELRVIRGGSWGVLLDSFSVAGAAPVVQDNEAAAYAFLKSLVVPATGLVKSSDCEQWTTVYKNALAAMAFIHEGDLPLAEGIFDFFDAQYQTGAFQLLPKRWDPVTGVPEAPPDYWEGDNAFLLIALDYYRQATGSLGDHEALAHGLVAWLARSVNARDWGEGAVIEEGLIDALAALKPFEADLPADTPDVLLKLHSAFVGHANWGVGDHVERAALTIGDLSGLAQVASLERTDTWQHDEHTVVRGMAANALEDMVNVEITAQLLLAWSIWRADAPVDLSYLQGELEKVGLRGMKDRSARGLPYATRGAAGDYDPIWYDYPMLDPTAYLLFHSWGFNPMVPGRKSLDLPYDFQDCEAGYTQTGVGWPELNHPDAVRDGTFQVGSAANEVTYTMHLHRDYSAAKMQIRYSDDVAGNTIDEYVDGAYRGTFTTLKTGEGWDTFAWGPDVALGALTAGDHEVKLVSDGGTYGVNLDIIRIAE